MKNYKKISDNLILFEDEIYIEILPLNIKFKYRKNILSKLIINFSSLIGFMSIWFKAKILKTIGGGGYISIIYCNELLDVYDINKIYLGYKHTSENGITYKNKSYTSISKNYESYKEKNETFHSINII